MNSRNNNNSYGIENDLLGCDFSWRPAPIPPQRKLPIESTEGPFVFGIHTQNSFNSHSTPKAATIPSPASSTKLGPVIRKCNTEQHHQSEINTSPNSSQVIYMMLWKIINKFAHLFVLLIMLNSAFPSASLFRLSIASP